MPTFWTEDAQLPGGMRHGVRLRVEHGRFVAVETEVAAGPGDERLAGVALPGLANAHSHAFHRVLRGRTQARGDFWSWRRQMYRAASMLQPDRYLALARAVYAEMALAGFTVVGEFHYLHHDHRGHRYTDPNAMGGALVEAARGAGVRLTLLDTCYLAGGLDPAGHQPLDPVQRRFADADVDAWATRMRSLADTPTTRVGAAAHSVRAVPEDQLRQLPELIGERVLHLHVSEQPAENQAVQSRYGCTPTALIADRGLLGPRTTLVHATHLVAADIRRIGQTRTRTCFCPTTERDLADGIGPARALHDAGSPLCLGSDQHAIIDPFEEIRGLEMHERLSSGARGRFSPDELLSAATGGGYASLGWPDGGRIEPGGLADFVTVRSDTVRTTACDPAQIIFAATAADIDRVVVAGRTVVQDGVHRLGPVAPLLQRAIRGLGDLG